ncbi:hypothetical protein AVEN_227083-1 [Araneus ventricosus]|uniref:Uncharacterized protein n=1 Tax=Araneus ventricosus TaxID=182803 RepID=A0A4Y2BWH6_ARAVE|nr:hypothetical protein AVEN_227083-1 [Araneus ventricosus]
MSNPDTREKRTLSPSGHEENTKKKIFTDRTQKGVVPSHRVSIKYRNMAIETAHPAPARLESTQFQQNKTPSLSMVEEVAGNHVGQSSPSPGQTRINTIPTE